MPRPSRPAAACGEGVGVRARRGCEGVAARVSGREGAGTWPPPAQLRSPGQPLGAASGRPELSSGDLPGEELRSAPSCGYSRSAAANGGAGGRGRAAPLGGARTPAPGPPTLPRVRLLSSRLSSTRGVQRRAVGWRAWAWGDGMPRAWIADPRAAGGSKALPPAPLPEENTDCSSPNRGTAAIQSSKALRLSFPSVREDTGGRQGPRAHGQICTLQKPL